MNACHYLFLEIFGHFKHCVHEQKKYIKHTKNQSTGAEYLEDFYLKSESITIETQYIC